MILALRAAMRGGSSEDACRLLEGDRFIVGVPLLQQLLRQLLDASVVVHSHVLPHEQDQQSKLFASCNHCTPMRRQTLACGRAESGCKSGCRAVNQSTLKVPGWRTSDRCKCQRCDDEVPRFKRQRVPRVLQHNAKTRSARPRSVESG